MKLSANDILLKLLGLLLLTAAVLKGYQLATEPVANTDLWSNRIFLIFTVEFKLAMAILLIFCIFRRIAGLAAIDYATKFKQLFTRSYSSTVFRKR